MKMNIIYNKFLNFMENKLDDLFGENRTLKNRIYNIATINITILIFFIIIVDLILQKNILIVVIGFVCLILQCVIFIICNYTKKVKIYSCISTIIMNIALGIFTYFTIIQGIVGLYIIMALLYTIILFSGRKRIILLSMEFLYYLLLFNYDASSIQNKTILYGTTIHSIIMFLNIIYISISLGISVLTILRLYDRKNQKLNDINNYLSKMSITDTLTGAWNRKHMEECLEKFINDKTNPLSIILFDIDYFKKVNDDYGHIAGDEILKKLVKIIKNTIGTKGIITRYGGEEFLIILPNMNKEETYNIAELVRKNVQKNLKIKTNKITVSGGCAEYDNKQSIYDFIEKADRKLYEAKENGRNKIMI